LFLKNGLYFGIIWLGNCFGYFSKNIGQFFSKSSGYPAQGQGKQVCLVAKLIGSAVLQKNSQI
jgi:hypothetical protein